MTKRIEWIDALKGFAIFAVVVGHCATDCMSSGTYPEHAALIRTIYDFIYSFHMPLFFMISGFVFFLSKGYRKIKVKTFDFAFVYLFWCFATWLSKLIMAHDVNNPVTLLDLVSVVYKPFMVYWYLYVLIFMYLVIAALKIEKVGVKEVLICAALSLASRFLSLDIGIVNAFCYHLFFFVWGGYLFSSGILERITNRQLFSLCGFVLLNCALYKFRTPVPSELFILKKFAVAAVVSLVCFLFFSKTQLSGAARGFLSLLGRNSLQIYVMHTFVTGGVRILLKKLDTGSVGLYFFLGTSLGIILPLIASKICEKSPHLNIVFAPHASLKKLGVTKE